MILLLFIYYYKNLLSFHDIEQLFWPITGQHFNSSSEPSLSRIYEEVFSLEDQQMERLKADIRAKFQAAEETFSDFPVEDQEYLQLFAFISELSFDVYLKKQMVEMMIDQLREESDADSPDTRKKRWNQRFFLCSLYNASRQGILYSSPSFSSDSLANTIS